MKKSIGIAGTGKMARTLGRFLGDSGEPVVCIAGRDATRTREAAVFVGRNIEPVLLERFHRDVSHVLIAVSDSAVEAVAQTVARRANPRVALHTCGVAGPEILEALGSQGAACGTLHPLQTVTGDENSVRALCGVSFGICGSERALEWAAEIIRLAHGTALRVREHSMPLYHAAAVMASNSVLALIDGSQSLLGRAGIDMSLALHAIAPLLRASIENAMRLGPVAALTGPIARGDLNTLETHCKALKSAPQTVRDLYLAAGLQAVQMARRQGLAPGIAEKLESILRT